MFFCSSGERIAGNHFLSVPIILNCVHDEADANVLKRRSNGLSLKFFTSNYLRNRQFSHRGMELDYSVTMILKNLNIYRYFNPKRGASSLRKSQRERPIFPISRERKPRVMEKRELNITRSNLIQVKNNWINYNFPTLLYTNLRAVRNKFDHVEASIKLNDAGIAVLTETWIDNCDSDAYNLPEFNVFHRIRQRPDKKKGGGVSIYLKKDLSILSVDFPSSIYVDALTVKFRASYLPRDVPWQALVAVYFPPSDEYKEELLTYIADQVDHLLSQNHMGNVFILGDFNNLQTHNVIDNKIFRQIVDKPTRKENILDKCFYKGSIKYRSVVRAPLGSSDHNVIILSPDITDDLFILKDRSIKYSCRPRRQSSQRSLGLALLQVNWSMIYDCDDVEQIVNIFNELMIKLYLEHYPEITRHAKSNDKPWFNEKLRMLLKLRNMDFEKGNMESVYTQNKLIRSEIIEAKKKSLSRQLSKIRSNSADYYKLLKETLNINSRKEVKPFPGKSMNDTLNEIKNYFENLYNSKKGINADVDTSNLPNVPIPEINLFWTPNQLRRVKNDNSRAPDGIPNFIFHDFYVELAEPINFILNKSLNNNYIPTIWKTSYLVPIPKESYIDHPCKLRPISILPSMSKILERHIFELLMDRVGGSLDEYQFGGLPKRSTLHYLILYIHAILRSKDKNENNTFTLITDFEKAYDHLDQNIFIAELINLQVPKQLVQWFISFLSNRHQWIKDPNGSKPLEFKSSNGVPQGSVLGGLVFIITTDNIGKSLDHHFKFVDDMSIVLTPDKNDSGAIIQSTFDNLQEEAQKYGMIINPRKSFLMSHNPHTKQPDVEIRTKESKIERAGSCKVLGLVVQENMKWDKHIDYIVAKANKRFFVLYRLKKLGLPTLDLKHIFVIFIRPILEYNSEIWSEALTLKQKNDLEKIQKRAVKIITGNWFLPYDIALTHLDLVSLEERRKDKLINQSKIFHRTYPQFFNKNRNEISNHYTRNSSKIFQPFIRTRLFGKSTIPRMEHYLNSLN